MIGVNLVAMGRIFIWYAVGLVVVSLCFVSPAGAQQEYEFVAKWGTQGSGPGQFLAPFGIAADSSTNVYVTDVGDGRVQKFTPAGQFIAQWSVSGPFVCPYGIAAGPSGNIYVADLCLIRIFKFSPTGQLLADWGTIGLGPGELICPAGIGVDRLENIYVTDLCLDRVEKFDPAGAFIMEWGTSGHGPGEFNSAWSLAADGDGNVYVADTGNGRVQRFNSTGTFIAQWVGAPYFDPIGIAVDRAGDVYTANDVNALVEKFTPSGSLVARWGSFGSGDGQFTLPWGVAADGAGNVYVVDPNAWRVQKFRPPASAEFFLSISTGDNQVVVVSNRTAPLTILARDGGGAPADGVAVDFAVSSVPAGAMVNPASTTTSIGGLASTILTLGNIPSEYRVTATCPTCRPEASVVTFKACGKLKNDDFKQYASAWKDDRYDTHPASKTIENRGCALTTMAILHNYFRERYSLDIPSTTPKDLNRYLTQNNGFDKNADLYFDKINLLSQDKVQYLKQVYVDENNPLVAVLNIADQDILNGLPVVFHIPSGTLAGHFLVGVGKCGDKYIVSDPGPRNRSFLDPAVTPVLGIRRFMRRTAP